MTAPAQQFKADAGRVTHDLDHRARIQTALKKYQAARDSKSAKFQDWQAARQAAAEIKWDAINHLDRHLVELAEKLEARGAEVHWAGTAEQARERGLKDSKTWGELIRTQNIKPD